MIIQRADGFTVCSTAGVVESEQVQAWAERHVRTDRDLKWILGNFVESEVPNQNGHIFPLQELYSAQASLQGKPLNMLHREHYIVGAFAGAQLLTAEGVEITSPKEVDYAVNAADATRPPYVEALAGMWHTRFPEEFFNIRRAHSEGNLYFSMESVPEEVSCPDCGLRTTFAGLESESYCAEMQGATGPKILHRPNFSGGAIIIPPMRPGWKRADVTAIAKYIEDNSDQADQAYKEVAAMAPHLEAPQWEQIMAEVMATAKDFSQPKRQKMAKQGAAMPDGSFPIESPEDVKNAIKLASNSKNPNAAKSHIKKMANKLGCNDLIPDEWK